MGMDAGVFESNLKAEAKRRSYDTATTEDYVTKGMEWLKKQQQNVYIPFADPRK